MRERIWGFAVVWVFVGASLSWAVDLGDVATVKDRTSQRSSSHDRTGGNADSINAFPPGATQVLLDADGPGQVTHIWMTLAPFVNHATFLRDLVIRMYWERSSVPSVEVPLGDFFVLGHAKTYRVESAPINVGNSDKALNCYWPMPFYRHARIEITNTGERSIRAIYYNIDYERGPIEPEQGLFHAMFRRERNLPGQPKASNTTGKDNYVIMETTGTGHYVGCALFVDAEASGWWGEGDDMIFIDHSEKPVIIGTGSEDYFCNAWGFRDVFNYPYYGVPLLEERPDGGLFTTAYRWHIPDPVRFNEHIRVTIEHIYKTTIKNDYSSVAYWYQTEPIEQRESLLVGAQNHPKSHGAKELKPAFELDGTELEAPLRSQGLTVKAVRAAYGDFAGGGYLEMDTQGKAVEVSIPVPANGAYHIELKPVNQIIGGAIYLGRKGAPLQKFEKQKIREKKVAYVDLGEITAHDGAVVFVAKGSPCIGIARIRVRKVAP